MPRTTTLDDVRREVDARLDAGDPPGAVALVHDVWRALAAESPAGLRELIETIPDDAWRDDPLIAAAFGASYRTARGDRSRSALAYFEASLATLASDAPDAVIVRLQSAAALRALGRLDDADEALDLAAEQAQSAVGPGIEWRVTVRAIAALQRGMVHLHRGRYDDAAPLLAFADGLGDRHLTRAEHVECLGGRALLAFSAGEIADAAGFADRARRAAEGTLLLRGPFAAPALTAELLSAIERIDAPTAHQSATELAAAAEGSDWEAFGWVTTARLHAMERDFSGALELLRRAGENYRAWAPAGTGAALGELLRAAILIRHGQGDAAWAVLSTLPADERHDLCPGRYIAQLRLVNGDVEGAAEALAACDALGELHAARTLADVQLLRAAIEHERGATAESALWCDRALHHMHRTGTRTPLIIVPPLMVRELMVQASQRRQPHGVADLVTRIRETMDARLASADGDGGMLAPLTTRETIVLHQLKQGKTVATIAQELFVSGNTMKTHLRNIYRKLGVGSRGEAVRKAQALGLYVTPGSPLGHSAPPEVDPIQ
ncbi:LuxR C-terminal-related transcriptional regulator [Schumannella sp. 10F1B-5-1]|uniref:LuxR C-terminal-related transcriptional regulator n=1 Tax=Schumannella sp. 10F1B-5-1 TaxID=2590780 RepID=UPI0011310151|nr:LuxR C-terminal-related transcriptional regulator [Schumannella sp. 10F1B-5-1]TPW73433.1 hypothetical protein FJ658_04345 [Schumannella sp. 10F1B-5-1]